MPEPLKNVYSALFFETFTAAISGVLPTFDKKTFLCQVFCAGWEQKELKQRMRHIATVLHNHLPGHYIDQVSCIIQVITELEKAGRNGGFEYMFLPDFVEQFGRNDLKTSLSAMERITQFASCEFAIRPFLLHHPDAVMHEMLLWSKHPHHHVRRFSSEGCRPRLPWAMAIPDLKKDPLAILPVLENLKRDASLFVRKSVANNLNDIAKDHPDVVVEVVKNWRGISPETDWIIRHGCRTLLKKAHPAIYELFNLSGATECTVTNLELSHQTLKIGETLCFSFTIKTGGPPAKLRMEYAVYYLKAAGKWSRKIFQLKEKTFPPNKTFRLEKKQTFQDFTTRKHYAGLHKVAIVINGKEMAEKTFMLLG